VAKKKKVAKIKPGTYVRLIETGDFGKVIHLAKPLPGFGIELTILGVDLFTGEPDDDDVRHVYDRDVEIVGK